MSGEQGERHSIQHIEGQIFHMEGYPPEMLEKFERVIDGSARQLLDNMLQESQFRREMEQKALEASIAERQRQFGVLEYENSKIAFSNIYGQTIGALICLSCIGAAVCLASEHPAQWKIALALIALPTAAIIRAFQLGNRNQKK